MTPGHRLYTPEVLDAATRLALVPLCDGLPLTGEARSPSCGSRVAIGLALDGTGKIAEVGISAHACAIGQASASIFSTGAPGRTREEIASARDAIADWLAGNGTMPDWPGLEVIAAAVAYPARHPAILLPWDAAGRALAQAAV